MWGSPQWWMTTRKQAGGAQREAVDGGEGGGELLGLPEHRVAALQHCDAVMEVVEGQVLVVAGGHLADGRSGTLHVVISKHTSGQGEHLTDGYMAKVCGTAGVHSR